MTLTELRELVGIFRKRNVHDNAIFDVWAIEHNEPRYQLYCGLKSGVFATAEQAATALYGSTPNDNRFRLIKSRLKQHLIDAVYTLCREDNNANPVKRAEHQVFEGMRKARLLEAEGANMTAFVLADKILSLAMKLDMTEAIVQFLPFCRFVARQVGKITEARYYNRLEDNYLRQYILLREVLRVQDKYVELWNKYREDLFLAIKELEEMAVRLCEIHQECPGNYHIALTYLSMEADLAEMRNDLPKVIEFGYKRIELIMTKEILSEESLAIYTTDMVMPLFIMGCKEEAERMITTNLAVFPPATERWHMNIFHSICTKLLAADYDAIPSALHTLSCSCGTTPIHDYPDKPKLSLGYIVYLRDIGRVLLNTDEMAFLDRVFDKQKFAAVFGYELHQPHPKNGRGVAILLLELLLTIESGDQDHIFSMQERLRLYYYRETNKENHPKARALLRLIQILLREDFDIAATRSKEAPYKTILQAVAEFPPSEVFPVGATVKIPEPWEILHSSDVWEIILERVAYQQQQGKLLPLQATAKVVSSDINILETKNYA